MGTTFMNLIERLMIEADQFAVKSIHPRSKVGCAMRHSFGAQLVGGFNQPIEGTEDWLHAEVDAIAKAAESSFPTLGAFMGLNWFPCATCATVIVKAGIRVLAYNDPMARLRWHDPKYNFQASHTILTNAGVELIPCV